MVNVCGPDVLHFIRLTQTEQRLRCSKTHAQRCFISSDDLSMPCCINGVPMSLGAECLLTGFLLAVFVPCLSRYAETNQCSQSYSRHIKHAQLNCNDGKQKFSINSCQIRCKVPLPCAIMGHAMSVSVLWSAEVELLYCSLAAHLMQHN